jgi:hypothetical protein
MLHIHHLQGRMRVSSSLLKKNPLLSEKIRSELRRLAGIHEIACNCVTGSILIYYAENILPPRHIILLISRHLRVANVLAFPCMISAGQQSFSKKRGLPAQELLPMFGNVLMRSVAEQLTRVVALRLVKIFF